MHLNRQTAHNAIWGLPSSNFQQHSHFVANGLLVIVHYASLLFDDAIDQLVLEKATRTASAVRADWRRRIQGFLKQIGLLDPIAQTSGNTFASFPKSRCPYMPLQQIQGLANAKPRFSCTRARNLRFSERKAPIFGHGSEKPQVAGRRWGHGFH